VPVLYEHWRPDLNECFYVGISRANPEDRPYDMNNRNPDHISMQREIAEKGFEVEVKIQAEADWLTKEVLCEIEPFQIKYWRELIGDRLINKCPGGSPGVIWTDEMHEKKQQKLKELRDRGEETPWQKGGKKITQRALELKDQGKITPNQIGGKRNSKRIAEMKERGEETPYQRGSKKGIITKRKKSKEEKAEINAKRNATIASKSNEEKEAALLKKSKNIKKALSKRTIEQKTLKIERYKETCRRKREAKISSSLLTLNNSTGALKLKDL